MADCVLSASSHCVYYFRPGPSCLKADWPNPGFVFFCSKVFSGIIFSILFSASN